MPKQTLTSTEARAALMRGVDAVANPVKATLGPRGLNVMMDRPNQPLVTRDGVTVAKEVSYLTDPFENMGAANAREVADAAVTEAGDGTTTASVLLQAIFKGGIALIEAGAEPLKLADGIQSAANACVETIKGMSIDATPELVEQVAIISTHGDRELGKMIAETTLKTGKSGVLELAESRNHETTVEHLEGYYFERGNTEPTFFTAGNRCTLENPYILISERVIVGGAPKLKGDHIFNVLQECVTARRSLLIIAEDLQGDAYNLFTAQVAQGTIPGGCFVKLPGFGETRSQSIRDLQVAVGANRIHSRASTRRDDVLSSFKLEDLGQCEHAIISTTRTVLIGGNFEPIVMHNHQEELINQVKDVDNPFEKAQLDARIARLTGGVAILRVGAHSEPAMIEKKARAEDAIHACRGAMESGVVVGGGMALLRAAQANHYLGSGPFNVGGKAGAYVEDDEPTIMGTGPAYEITDQRRGAQLLLDAIREPATQIIRNAGHDNPEVEIEKAASQANTMGYDSSRGEHCDLLAAGIVDPTKVVMVALSKAASIAALLLTTEVLITETPNAMLQSLANPAMFRV